MLQLNKEKADALCTAIILGYAKTKKEGVCFEWEPRDQSIPAEKAKEDQDKADYENVRNLFGNKGVTIKVGASVNKDHFPFIVAIGNAIPGTSAGKLVMTDEANYAQSLERKLAPVTGFGETKGAYLGGYATISTINLVGVSNLGLYQPVYRSVDTTIAGAYNQARYATEKVNAWVTEQVQERAGGLTINGIKAALNSTVQTTLPDYQAGKLFKSYHGMIVAMTHFQSDISQNKDGIFFEIAAGKDTNKVSSCFPCATYMVSAGKPPTSIHLGRGDNWAVPGGALYKSTWESNIRSWFNDGKAAVSGKLGDVGTASPDIIPAVFLEALTFEGSFTDKIINTLKS